jgi:hypothetical protein
MKWDKKKVMLTSYVIYMQQFKQKDYDKLDKLFFKKNTIYIYIYGIIIDHLLDGC